MLEPAIAGILTGAVMSIMLGTVFFALIQNSIENGFRSGMLISLGVISSDLILIVISIFNADLIPSGGTTEFIVRICGSVFLVLYGLRSLLSVREVKYPDAQKKNFIRYFMTGFALNILNPGNFIGWITVSTHLKQVNEFNNFQCTLFYSGALGAIFMTELLISYLGSTLKSIISNSLLRKIDKIAGIIFILFAFLLWWPLLF